MVWLPLTCSYRLSSSKEPPSVKPIRRNPTWNLKGIRLQISIFTSHDILGSRKKVLTAGGLLKKPYAAIGGLVRGTRIVDMFHNGMAFASFIWKVSRIR